MSPITREEFNLLLADRYIFHIHTRFSDGDSSIIDYIRFARSQEINTIVFTDHIRKKPSYDFNEIFTEIEAARSDFPGMNLLVGAEAKILPAGQLDIMETVMEKLDVLCIACHYFPLDVDLYYSAMSAVFSDNRFGGVRVWVHPALFLHRNRNHLRLKVFRGIFHDLVQMANRQKIYGELNLKYSLPERYFSPHNFRFPITGTDAHSVKELTRYYQ